MTNWGRRPVTDAGKAKTKPPVVNYYYDGELRIDRRPLGRVERFVDPQGTVVSLQLAGDGDAMKGETVNKLRMQYRRDGFVEHAKCPLRHGTHLHAGVIAKDFKSMPADLLNETCSTDPRTMIKQGHDLHATEGCQHIEWLIKFRREQEAKQAAKRNEARAKAEERAAAKQRLEEIQLEEAVERQKERKARKPKATE